MELDRAGSFGDAVRRTRTADLRLGALAASGVVLVSCDNSAMLAEALRGLGPDGPRVPLVGASASLPAFVGPDTLVVADSRRGDGLCERLAREALGRGARLVRLGGPSAATSRESPHVVVSASDDPGPLSLLGATLVVLERACVVGDLTGALSAAEDQLGRRAARESEALEIARRIGRRFPLAWGVEGIGAAAAEAFRAEMNLRAKSPAHSARLPAASYVDVAGFGQSGDVTRQLVVLVRFSHSYEPSDVAARAAAAVEAISETLSEVLVMAADGDGPLAQACDLLLAGEQIARAAAAREGIDADATPVLDDIARVTR